MGMYFPTCYRNPPYFYKGAEFTINGLNTILHETFLHGEEHQKRYFSGNTSSYLNSNDHSSSVFDGSEYAKHGVSIMKNALTIINLNSKDVKSISDARLNLMLHWGRGVDGIGHLLKKKDGDTISKEEVINLEKNTK